MPKPFLLRRPSGIFARFLVPTDLRVKLGQRFIIRRLPPCQLDQSRLVAARMAVALSQAFDALRQGGGMDDWKKHLEAVRNGRLSEWSGNIDLGNGVKLTDLQVNGRDDAQALLDTINGMGTPNFVPSPPPAHVVTLASRIDAYLQDLKNSGTEEGNHLDAKNTLTIFRELTGDQTHMSGIKDQEVRKFLTDIQSWPANARKFKEFEGLDAARIISETKRINAKRAQNNEPTMPLLSPRSLGKHRDRLATFLNAQVAAGIIPVSPLKGIRRHKEPTKGSNNARRAFTKEEIDQAFDMATFLPWTHNRPDRYWGALLGLASGARLNEIAQLYADDVEEVAGVWGIHIRATRPDQKLKVDSTARFVPLHPKLIEAGFLLYVADVVAGKHQRLFPHLPWHRKAGYGDALGDQFRAYLDKIGMTDGGLGFHAFRHTAATRMLYGGISAAVGGAITGHGISLPGAMKEYIDPPSIPVRAAAVAVLPVPEGLPKYESGDAAEALKQAHVKAKRREVNAAARKRKAAHNSR